MDSRSIGCMCNILIKKIMFLIVATLSDFCASYFMDFPPQAQPTVLSSKAKDAAAEIEHRLQLGSKLSDVVSKKEDLLALFDLYRNEGYILAEHKAIFYVSQLSPRFSNLHFFDFFFSLCFYLFIWGKVLFWSLNFSKSFFFSSLNFLKFVFHP